MASSDFTSEALAIVLLRQPDRAISISEQEVDRLAALSATQNVEIVHRHEGERLVFELRLSAPTDRPNRAARRRVS